MYDENVMNIIYESLGIIEPLNELKGSQTEADELKRIYDAVLVLEDEFFKLIGLYIKSYNKMYVILKKGKPSSSAKDIITKLRDVKNQTIKDEGEMSKERRKKMENLGFHNPRTIWEELEKKSKKFINLYGDASAEVKIDMLKKIKKKMDECKSMYDMLCAYGHKDDWEKLIDKYEEISVEDRKTILNLVKELNKAIERNIDISYDELTSILKMLKLDKYNSGLGKFLQKIKL